MKFVAENVSHSAVVLTCFGDDTGGGVEHPLQLVCGGFWRLGEHGVAVVNARRHESVNQRRNEPKHCSENSTALRQSFDTKNTQTKICLIYFSASDQDT